ncbi:MAG: ATP-binding cassette domain-containing protein [Sterolibacterium sp.]|nr:ATP-binding cassette domain-containing protein [Sterolibacterium sp.]MBP9799711.1 ATP-binding cassette domain-containing protein [Sterolibacterium sp.]
MSDHLQVDLAVRKTLHSGGRQFVLDVRVQTASRRLVLFGPSGAGKSLTLKAVAGLLRPDEGHVRLAGETLFDAAQGIDLAPQQRHLGYLFQDYALFPHLTVRQNIASAWVRGWRNPRRNIHHERVDYWLAAMHLEAQAGQYPAELSGGQRQRTALARALVAEPRALLLDEPFAALDPALRARMRAELDALQRQLEVPMILITHDPEDAAWFGEEVVFLAQGRVQEQEQWPALATMTAATATVTTGAEPC